MGGGGRRLSNESSHSASRVSHGRGGAGNIGNSDDIPPVQADLGTPTLKSQVYTTGRGGSGNMAKNDPDHPDKARAAQDVDVPLQRLNEGPTHSGRGGVANVYKPSEDERDANKEYNQRLEEEARLKRLGEERDAKGLADRGKEFLLGHLTGHKA